jgi:hypothetical protein
MIARLDLAAIADLKKALPRFAHRPVAHLSHLRPEQVVAYWLDEITEELADESSVAFAARGRELIEGLVLYADLPWDTKVVGRRIGLLKHLAAKAEDARSADMLDALLDEAIRYAASRETECLTCKIRPLQFAAVHALERHGFLLMDTILDFVFDFSRTPLEGISVPKRANGLTTRLATPEDLSEVLAVSEKAFANYFGRYNSDPKMPHGAATEVYREWVRSSFRGWADWILVAEIEGRIAGFGSVEKGVPTRSQTCAQARALQPRRGPPGFFWARHLYGACCRRNANDAKFRAVSRRAGTRQQLSSSSCVAKTRLEDCGRKALLSQMA